jgi:hypothetical protein
MWGRKDVLRLAMALIEKEASLQEEMLRRYLDHNQGNLNL